MPTFLLALALTLLATVEVRPTSRTMIVSRFDSKGGPIVSWRTVIVNELRFRWQR